MLKFGGTSVGSSDAIKRVFGIVSGSLSKNPVVIVSAFFGITDSLVQLFNCRASGGNARPLKEAIAARHLRTAKELGFGALEEVNALIAGLDDSIDRADVHDDAFKDELLSYGERLSGTIIAAYFNREGLDCSLVDSRDLIVTDDNFGHAHVDMHETFERIKNAFSGEGLRIVTGFIARNSRGRTTTLGRGGSDYTASLIGAALRVKEIQIWTDVSGLCTADPRRDAGALLYSAISYRQAYALAEAGAKVLYPAAIPPAEALGIPIRIKNTFDPAGSGTLITSDQFARYAGSQAA